MVYLISDIHFSSEKEWKLEIGKKFVDYCVAELAPRIKESDYAIMLGDAIDRISNPGSVYFLLTKLYDGFLSRFKKVFIIPGNHEYKIYEGSNRAEFGLDFLSDFENVEIIKEPFSRRVIDGKTCLFLPHNPYVGVCEKWYEQQLSERNEEPADYAFGHFMLRTKHVHPRATAVSRDLIPAKRCIFGHVHTQIDPEYPGSCFAVKVDEVEQKRMLIVDFETGAEAYHDFPNFVEYNTITYPEKIQEKSKLYTVQVYDVIGNISEDEASQHYKGHWVSKVISPLYALKRENSKNFNDVVESSEDFAVHDYLQAYEDMKAENNRIVSEKVDNLVKSILSNNVAE